MVYKGRYFVLLCKYVGYSSVNLAETDTFTQLDKISPLIGHPWYTVFPRIIPGSRIIPCLVLFPGQMLSPNKLFPGLKLLPGE